MFKLVTTSLLTMHLLILLSLNSQAQLIVSGEFRPRLEYRDGYSKLRDSSQTPYVNILGRSRLILDFKSEPFTVKFSLQHAYVFGENSFSSDTITRNTINIYEGWFRYAFSKGFSMKIGRMELNYEDMRLLGNSSWSPKGATHDVVMAEWGVSQAGYKGDFGFAINNTAPASAYMASYSLKNYKYMAYLYEQKKFFRDNLTFGLLAILDVNQKTGSTNPSQLYGRITAGGSAGYAWKNLKIYASGYYQSGHFNNGKTINAGFFGGYASYKVVKPLVLLVGYEWFSGNNFSDTTALKTKTTSFSTLYGSAHGFYGYMDLFSPHCSGGNSAGLTDLYARATLSLSGKTAIEATYRMFGLEKGYLPATIKKTGDVPYKKVEKNLGSEIDLMFTYKILSNFELNAAYCFFLPTSTMEQMNGLKTGKSEWAQYAYLMLTYKPVFFNSEKH